jgi:hypothetical protein
MNIRWVLCSVPAVAYLRWRTFGGVPAGRLSSETTPTGYFHEYPPGPLQRTCGSVPSVAYLRWRTCRMPLK